MHRIFLIGPMGSGKTAVGRQLAKVLGLEFHDSDVELELRTGVDIPYIFDKEGETGFRQREREVIDSLTQLDSVVIATGGGAVLLPENREHLQLRGCVVYLRTSVDQQVERTRSTRHRPLLYTEDPRQRLAELMAIRAPLYESTATFTIDTDGRRVATVVDEIVTKLGTLARYSDPCPQNI
jgi:shikimate kinase